LYPVVFIGQKFKKEKNVAAKCEMTQKEELKVIAAVEKGYQALPENATTMEILEMIADVLGEPVIDVHKRFTDIQEKKNKRKKK